MDNLTPPALPLDRDTTAAALREIAADLAAAARELNALLHRHELPGTSYLGATLESVNAHQERFAVMLEHYRIFAPEDAPDVVHLTQAHQSTLDRASRRSLRIIG